MPIREHHYRTPPARLHNGVPPWPRYMQLGTDILTVDDARLVAVTHDPKKARAVVHVVSESGGAATLEKGERSKLYAEMKREAPVVVPGGARFAFVPQSCQEVIGMLGIDDAVPDEGRFVPAPEDAPVDAEETPGLFVVHIHRDGSVFLFLRSWETPYALRVHLTREDKVLLAESLRNVVAEMTPEEFDHNVTALDVPCLIGPQPERKSEDEEAAPKMIDVREVPAARVAPTPPPEEKSPGIFGHLKQLLRGA